VSDARAIGPNVKQLITKRMAVLAIPPGTKSALGAGLAALLDSAKLRAHATQATDEVLAAIDAVKAAPDNTFGSDDEAIAGEMLRRARERLRR
jgi:hypothetical protein